MLQQPVHHDVRGCFLPLAFHDLGFDSGPLFDQTWSYLEVSFVVIVLELSMDVSIRPCTKVAIVCAAVFMR